MTPQPTGALSINEAADYVRIGRTKLYELIASGQLSAKRLGSRTLIMRSDLESYLSSLPAAKMNRATRS